MLELFAPSVAVLGAVVGPVVAAVVALGRAVRESSDDRSAAVVAVALSSIALFLLGMSDDVPARERVLMAACAGTVWLLGRARRDSRLLLAAICAVALLSGAEPPLGLGLVPALALTVYVARVRPARFWSHGGVLFVVGVLVGYAMVGRLEAWPTWPKLSALSTWLIGGLRAVGPVALVLAMAAIVVGVSSAQFRRIDALAVLFLLVASVATGQFDALALWLVALAIGIGLVECAAYLARLQLPGARLVLAPLVVLVLAEAFWLRASRLEWPALGPVPPHAVLSKHPCDRFA